MEETGYVMLTELQHASFDYIMLLYFIFLTFLSLMIGLKRSLLIWNQRIKFFVNRHWPYHQLLKVYLHVQKHLFFRYQPHAIQLLLHLTCPHGNKCWVILLQRTPENGNVLNGEAKKTLVRESCVILSLLLYSTLLIERENRPYFMSHHL